MVVAADRPLTVGGDAAPSAGSFVARRRGIVRSGAWALPTPRPVLNIDSEPRPRYSLGHLRQVTTLRAALPSILGPMGCCVGRRYTHAGDGAASPGS